MDLKQKLVADIMKEAGDKIAAVDANIGLIAEAEALSEKFRKALPGQHFTGHPVISICGRRLSVWVQASHQRRSDVIAAIERAGLVLDGETEEDDGKNLRIHIDGLQVDIVIANVIPELAEAA